VNDKSTKWSLSFTAHISLVAWLLHSAAAHDMVDIVQVSVARSIGVSRYICTKSDIGENLHSEVRTLFSEQVDIRTRLAEFSQW